MTKIDKKIIQFKEERNFVSRLIVAARSRPKIDISIYFDEHQFSAIFSFIRIRKFAPINKSDNFY